MSCDINNNIKNGNKNIEYCNKEVDVMTEVIIIGLIAIVALIEINMFFYLKKKVVKYDSENG